MRAEANTVVLSRSMTDDRNEIDERRETELYDQETTREPI